MILIIDNYDSFTHNLMQYTGEINNEIKVIRNDEINIKEINLIKPTHIILSPGPGHPSQSKISLEIIKNYGKTIPILGVCLGHQAIGYVHKCNIKQLDIPMHGKTSFVFHDNQDLFKDLPNPFMAIRYHSLSIDNTSIKKARIKTTAWTKQGTIMGCRHEIYTTMRGVQFHPESLWTQEGKTIIKNFLTT